MYPEWTIHSPTVTSIPPISLTKCAIATIVNTVIASFEPIFIMWTSNLIVLKA